MSDDQFLNSVIETSSATRVDIDSMRQAQHDIGQGIDALDRALISCGKAGDSAAVSASLEPADYDLCLRFTDMETRLSTRREELARMVENVGMSMLIYLAAENRAAEFFALRAAMFPNPISYLDYVMEAPVFSLPVTSQPGSRKKTWTLRQLLPNRFAYTGARTLAGALPFILSRGNDRGQGFAESYYVEQLSRDFLRQIGPLWLTQMPTTQGRKEGQGSWWRSEQADTPLASGVMLSGVRGWIDYLGYGKSSLGISGWKTDEQGKGIPVHGALPRQHGGPYVALSTHDSSLFTQAISLGSLLGMPGQVSPAQGATVGGSGTSRPGSGPQMLPSLPDGPTADITPGMAASPSQIFDRIGDLKSSAPEGQFEILRHETPDGHGGVDRSWTVVIRGTQDFGVGGFNPQDTETNLAGVAGFDNDQSRLIKEAMELSGIGAGEPVEFVGHSQGGIVASQLASDPAVSKKYEVASVLSAGGPTGHYAPEVSAGSYHFENFYDIVPALDGAAANSDGTNSTTLYFDGATLLDEATGERQFDHDLSLYSDAIHTVEGSGASQVQSYHEWMERRAYEMHLNEETRTTSLVFNTTRAPVSTGR